MSRKLSVDVAKRAFNDVLGQATSLFEVTEPICKMSWKSNKSGPIHPKQANKFIGLAFMSLISCWEEFLEMSFIRYLAGAGTKTDISLNLE